MKTTISNFLLLLALTPLALVAASTDVASLPSVKIAVDWNKTTVVSKTTPTMLVLPHPLMRKGRHLHDPAFRAVKSLDANYVRYLLFFPYPHLAVAEMEPPTKERTSWDFSLIDPEIIEFLDATKGREPIIDFSTIPAWMFKTDKPVDCPADPDQLTHCSLYGKELVDPSGNQVADYYVRVMSWYTKGGFTDENGKYHRSGYHYKFPWWGILNETDGLLTTEQYVILYDAIVSALHKLSPETKFVALSTTVTEPPGFSERTIFEYFLNPKNHQANIPLGMISYHFYALPGVGQTIENWQYTFFDQANGFMADVKYIDAIRRRLSPSTKIDVEEIGSYLPDDLAAFVNKGTVPSAPPLSYWNLSGAIYAYIYVELAKQGIDIATQSELVGEPGYFPNDAMLNWTTGNPNARFRVLQLIKDNFGPGDTLVATDMGSFLDQDVAAQAFATSKGKRLLVINKRLSPVDIHVNAGESAYRMDVVDVTTGESPPLTLRVKGDSLHLEPFAVAVLSFD